MKTTILCKNCVWILVFAVAGILGACSLKQPDEGLADASVHRPVLSDAQVRSGVQEALALAVSAQKLVEDNAKAGRPLSEGWMLPLPTKTVQFIRVDGVSGVVVVSLTVPFGGTDLVLSPATEGRSALVTGAPVREEIIWMCASNADPDSQLARSLPEPCVLIHSSQ